MTSCGCKRAVHVHGDLNTYRTHKCRCEPCRAAKAREDRYYSLRKVRSVEYVGVEIVRAQIRRLLKTGLNMQAIARISGLHPKVLEQLNSTTHARQRSHATRRTYDAIMAVDYKAVAAYRNLPGAVVDSTIAREQVRALHCMGWCPESLAEQSGLRIPLFYRLLQGHGIRERMRAEIEALYLELRDCSPPDETEMDRKRIERAKTRAKLSGWSAEAAEDWFDSRAA